MENFIFCAAIDLRSFFSLLIFRNILSIQLLTFEFSATAASTSLSAILLTALGIVFAAKWPFNMLKYMVFSASAAGKLMANTQKCR